MICSPGFFFPIYHFRFWFLGLFFPSPALVFYGYVNSCLVWSVRIGRGQNWLGKPSGGRNLTERSRGASYSFLHTLKSTRREGMAWGNWVAVKGILPCVGWCRYCGGQAKSGVGVHSSVVELTRLAILSFHCLSSLRNPTVGWFECALMCTSYVWSCCFIIPFGNHA